ncbi:MAG: phosphotransacetylase family protein [Candidatus Abyssobacteria bacterium SURF_17]|uniref:Phosphotransacetylase family protein n=1 Tax=Candidatus Abyssobacteria bacterium SURF_17 TaxID=2093361 RepID=A0A419EMY4_9BACT|nr:MAG: phosphotransacetylase family protein [Candidatus Abyssubacteria bacterium SURF_17]
MTVLFVDSLSEYTGRNTICLSLGIKLRGAGKSVGFFKPLGVFPTRVDGVPTDEDMVFFKEALGLGEALDDLCPVVLTQELLNEVLAGKLADSYAERTRDAFKKVSANKDITIVVGIGYVRSGMIIGLSEADFLKETDGKLLLTDRFGWVNRTVDRLLATKQDFGDRLLGVVFNRMEPKKMDFVTRVAAPYLKGKGIDVLGVVPEDSKLGAVTVDEILHMLNGELLCCEDKLDEVVERFSIGAMTADAALRHFMKIRDKAVITGGDRADIVLAALDTPTKCLVLTGNLYPNDVVLARAQAAGVPVIVVPGDTLEAVEKFEAMMGRLSIRETRKVDYAVQLMEQHIDYHAIFRKLGL